MENTEKIILKVIESNKENDLSIMELEEKIKESLSEKNVECAFINTRVGFNIPQVIIVVLNDKAHFIKSNILEKYAIERDNKIAQEIADFVNNNIDRINRDMSLIEMIAFGKLMQYHTVTLIENVEKQGDDYLISFSNNKSIALENTNGKFEYKIA